LGRRRLVRSLAGGAALAIVVGLELLRRSGDQPASAPPRPSGSAVPSPTGSLGAEPDPPLDPALPSLTREPIPGEGNAQLVIDLAHTLRAGLLLVSVDEQQVVRERFSATAVRSFLWMKLREGRFRRQLEVKAGRRRVRVELTWDEGRRSQTIVGTFKAGGRRRLAARLSRLTQSLTLEWQ
jgi:hypothetical protein